VILAIIAPAVVWVFYGSRFMPSVDATRLLLPGIVMGSIYKVLGADLAARGKPLYAAWAYAVAVVLNVALNFYLIPRYGFRGAAVASSISYSVGSLLYLGIYVRNHNIRLVDAVVPRASDFAPITRKLNKLIKRR
jgi:O-antigen/teichoic acid export membrane protein